MRRQYCVAGILEVFVVTANKNPNEYAPNLLQLTVKLPLPISLTPVFLRYALPVIDQVYRKGSLYLKAVIILSDLTPENTRQYNLFMERDTESQKKLMEKTDNINFSMCNDTVKFASSGILRNWRCNRILFHQDTLPDVKN
jgi:DNA polymerase V